MMMRLGGLALHCRSHLPLHLSLIPVQALSVDAKPQTSAKRGTNALSLAALAFGGTAAGVALYHTVLQPIAPSPTDKARPRDAVAPEALQVPLPPLGIPTTSNDNATASDALSTRSHAASANQRNAEGQQNGTTLAKPGPWVIDEDMELVMHRRAVTKNRLTAYLHSMQQHMHGLASQASMMGQRGESWFQEQMKALEPVVDLQAQIILFGVDEPNARRKFLVQYGCTKWTDRALETIKGFGPIIEIGAGHGHWQHALAEKGVDVLAFDDKSALPMEGLPDVGVVQQGNEQEIHKHRRRTLLLVYPGNTDMAANCLREYKGDYVLYVGESRGGVNANDLFFDLLEKEWDLESVEALDPFPEGYESLYVLRRKGRRPHSKGKSWLPRLW